MDFNLISKVELITDDNRSTLGTVQDKKGDMIYVSLIIDKNKFKILRPGDKVNGIITDENKVFGFIGMVNRRLFNKMPMYEINVEKMTRVQRRDHFRVDCSMPVIYSSAKNVLNIKEGDLDSGHILSSFSEEFSEGVIKDISAGGVKLISDEKLEIGTKILLLFKFIDKEFILKGQIVYGGDNDTSKGLKYRYGIQFIEITFENRESIIKNIFILIRTTIHK